MTRRSAALVTIGSAFSFAVTVAAAPAFAAAKEEISSEEKEAIAIANVAAKERMRKKIEDSKKNYRKTSDLVKERKDTTDYSCLVFNDCPAKTINDKLSSEETNKSGVGK